jgi:hypothetical protein
MGFKIKNGSVIYPDEDISVDRDLILRIDQDEKILHFDLIDKVKYSGGFSLLKLRLQC